MSIAVGNPLVKAPSEVLDFVLLCELSALAITKAALHLEFGDHVVSHEIHLQEFFAFVVHRISGAPSTASFIFVGSGEK